MRGSWGWLIRRRRSRAMHKRMRRGKEMYPSFDTRRVLCKQHLNYCVKAAILPHKQSCFPSMRTQNNNRKPMAHRLQTRELWANCYLIFGVWAKALRCINPRAIKRKKTGLSALAQSIWQCKSRAVELAMLAMDLLRFQSGAEVHTRAKNESRWMEMQTFWLWLAWITQAQAFTILLGCLCRGLLICRNPLTFVALLGCGPAKMMWRGCFSTHPPVRKLSNPLNHRGLGVIWC
jgi:hypothetical protein